MDLWKTLDEIKDGCRFVELSHEVSPDTPHWSGFPDMKDDIFFSYDRDGFYANEYHMVSQYGTHVDAPCHFIRGGRSVDMIGAEEMILPLCVIDISRKAEDDADYAASVDDILAYEERYGRIPSGSFCALRTDWSKRDELDNMDADGNKHYPGWALEAVRFLVEQRKVTAIGHETSDTDSPAISAVTGYVAENYILENGLYQIELMKDLDKVPPEGAVIICSFPRVKGGSGFTARCIAICEKGDKEDD